MTLWGITLAAGAAVIIVVAVLLELIVRAARGIHRRVADIWTGGKQIAQNTSTIVLLQQTNHLAGQLLESADGLGKASRELGRITEGKS